MRISDWSSDVCSSDLGKFEAGLDNQLTRALAAQGVWDAPVESLDFVLEGGGIESDGLGTLLTTERCLLAATRNPQFDKAQITARLKAWFGVTRRSEEHTSELQSLMRISYAVFCLKKKKKN